MRYTLLIYQNTGVWNGQEIAARWPDAQHWGMGIRALMHGGGGED
jgi:hypothetical protein